MRKTVDAQEIQKFQADSARWWDEAGPFAPLHRLNPVRLAFIRDTVASHFEKTDDLKPLKNLKILDIGCGGGLVCEPLARLGADLTGIDADGQAIAVAQDHAEKSGLNISYQAVAAEALAIEKQASFDVVMALEIAEHVTDLDALVLACATLCKPGGLVIFSTLNRTPQSYIFGIVAAEYLLRWVPAGTHSWKKFIRPSELAAIIDQNGLAPDVIKGLSYSPLSNEFNLSDNVSVNYFLTGVKR